MASHPFDDKQDDMPQEAGMTRREFLRFASGLVVLFSLNPTARAQTSPGPQPETPDDLNAWLRIGPDSRVTLFTPTPEVGQGVRTSLAQMAAEELTIPVSSVDMVMGDTDLVPAGTATGATPTIATVGLRVRDAAAEAREILAEMAAEKWGVSRAAVRVLEGQVMLADDPGTAIPLGELTRGQRFVRRLHEAPRPEPIGVNRVVGRSVPRADGHSLVTGEARFVADLRLPDMVYGKVFRPPCFGARLLSSDTGAVARQPGVIAVVEEGDFIAVVASRPDLAEKALRHIQATWEEAQHPLMASLYQGLRDTAQFAEAVEEQGDVEGALASARHGFSASYRAAFVAHAPIEPHAAVATPDGDRITVYASTQQPFAHRAAVAQTLGLPVESVRVITPAVGGAFGGKDTADVSVEAARLARAVQHPVMVTHSREEELTWNYFRPAALLDVQCGVSEGGQIAAWACDVFNCGSRGAVPPYAFPNQRIRAYRCQSPLRQGPWRGLGGPANTFAREAHLDHVASALGRDPIEFRLSHLAEHPRMARVVRAAAESYGWRTHRPPTGFGVGFACAADSGTCVAQIAEVEVGRISGEVQVRRLLIAHDSGLVINPDGIRNQIEGAVIMGLGFTLREAVRYEEGRILTESFASYPIPTLRDTPAIHTVLVPNPGHPPQGGGTPAIFPIAAAVANAVFDAIGRRIRELPLSPNRVRAALRAEP